MRVLVTLAFVASLFGGGFATGVQAYAEKRYADALAAFTATADAAGDQATAELLYNKALAALAAGQLRIAESEAEKAAARGGSEFEGLRDFLHGNVEFARCTTAAAESALQEADPTVLSQAIGHAKRARAKWQLAAATRPDWPSARRNIERVTDEIANLERRKKEAEEKRRKSTKPPPDQPGEEDSEDEDEREEEAERAITAQKDPGQISNEALAALLAKLGMKEAEKRALRRAEQQAPQGRRRQGLVRSALAVLLLAAVLPAQRAFVEVVAPRDRYFVQERVSLRLRFGIEKEFLRKNLIQPFRQRMDVPVRLDAPWLGDLAGTVALPEEPDERVKLTFVAADSVSRAARAADVVRDGKSFTVLEITRSYLPIEAGPLVVPGAQASIRARYRVPRGFHRRTHGGRQARRARTGQHTAALHRDVTRGRATRFVLRGRRRVRGQRAGEHDFDPRRRELQAQPAHHR